MARGQLRIGDQQEREPEDEVVDALAAFGLQAEETLEIDDKFALWPECVDVFKLWQAVQTQWRTGGMGGATGLDYAGVEACMKLRGIRNKDRTELFNGLQVMEQATLQEWALQK